MLRGPSSAQNVLEAAGTLGNRHGQHRLALLAQFGLLGDETQAVEIHVGAAGDGDQRFAAACLSRST